MADKKTQLPIIRLLPNLLTVAAICAGLTAIRFGFQGGYERAVQLILLAAILDGLDGRLARMGGWQTEVGAELDSLADFLNFGIAPGLIVYFWTLQNLPGAGWIAVLAYVVCCVLRLARFNVSNRADVEPEAEDSDFFVGVPSPAGAVLVMLPMFISFLFSEQSLFPPEAIAIYMIVVGLLMISHIPTYAFKKIAVRRENAKFVLLGFVLLVAALLTYLWATLVLLSLVYIAGIVGAFRKKAQTSND